MQFGCEAGPESIPGMASAADAQSSEHSIGVHGEHAVLGPAPRGVLGHHHCIFFYSGIAARGIAQVTGTADDQQTTGEDAAADSSSDTEAHTDGEAEAAPLADASFNDEVCIATWPRGSDLPLCALAPGGRALLQGRVQISS